MLNGCIIFDFKIGGNVYQYYQFVVDMNIVFVELINREMDDDIQNSLFIVIFVDESVDIVVYKKLDFYIRFVKVNEFCI